MKDNELQQIITQELNIVLNEFNLKGLIRSVFYKIFGPKVKPKKIDQVLYTRPDKLKYRKLSQLDRAKGLDPFRRVTDPSVYYTTKKDFMKTFENVIRQNQAKIAKMKQGDSINLDLPSGGHINLYLTKNELAGTFAHSAGGGGKFKIHVHDEEFFKLMQPRRP